MSDSDNKIRDLSTLREMMAKGKNYREEFELEMFGEPVVLVMKPIPDDEYTPIQATMQVALGLTDEEAMEKIEQAREEDDEGRARLDNIEVDDPDLFGEVLKRVALASIDPEAMGGTRDDLEEMFDGAVGGYTPEIAYKGMEVTGNLRDAKRFRGGRGS